MAVKVAINGFGRIGRLAFRLMFGNAEFDIVAIYDLTEARDLAYLLKYDSAQGRWKEDSISSEEGYIIVDGKKVKVLAQKDPTLLPWKDLDVDVVIECTGVFVEKSKAMAHIQAGAKKVIISAPAKGVDKTIVYNVNHTSLTGEEQVISAASCTTNCLAPVCKVLDENFGIVKGYMTTVHSYTNDQNLLDGPHKKGIYTRRARAAAANIVPTTTGAASAIGEVLPQLKGKLNGNALRVPTVTGSVIVLVFEPGRNVTEEEVNAAMKKAANETLEYSDDPIVSTDVVGRHCGALFDSLATDLVEYEGKQLVQVIAFYDNEMSYTSQLVRTAKYLVQVSKGL
jgi:glyceraldehyde 3-phosphate dehydrogenase